MAKLVSYWKKQKAGLRLLLKIPKKKFGKRNIHLFRVELKKLKALLLMTEFQNKEFDRKKYYKPFRKLFSLTGKVRELQIEKAILKKFNDKKQIQDFLKFLDRKIEAKKKVFFKNFNSKLNSKIEMRLKQLNPTIRKLEKTNFSDYFKNLVLEIKLLLVSEKLDETNGHLFRKKLQTLLYNLESLSIGKDTLSIPEYEELLKLLGSWHDMIRSDELLKIELGSMKYSPGEIIGIQQIRQKIAVTSEKLIQEINLKAPLLADFIIPSKSLT